MFIFPQVLLVQSFCELGAGRHYLLEDGLLWIERVVLLEESYLDVLEEHDLSARI